jgi:hypothetical protein
MGFELTEERKNELDDIVDKMNREADFTLLYDKGTPEYQTHFNSLSSFKKMVLGLEEHERTYVLQGLLDRKDEHEFHFSELDEHERYVRQCLESPAYRNPYRVLLRKP